MLTFDMICFIHDNNEYQIDCVIHKTVSSPPSDVGTSIKVYCYNIIRILKNGYEIDDFYDIFYYDTETYETDIFLRSKTVTITFYNKGWSWNSGHILEPGRYKKKCLQFFCIQKDVGKENVDVDVDGDDVDGDDV
jgi:hypothetical protein